jgi:hypothetical protein
VEKDRVILTMFRDDVRCMIENAEDKKLDNVLVFFKSANVYSRAADSPIVHIVFDDLDWNYSHPLVRFVEWFVNGNVPYHLFVEDSYKGETWEKDCVRNERHMAILDSLKLVEGVICYGKAHTVWEV